MIGSIARNSVLKSSELIILELQVRGGFHRVELVLYPSPNRTSDFQAFIRVFIFIPPLPEVTK